MTQLEDQDLKKIEKIRNQAEKIPINIGGPLKPLLYELLDVIRDHQHVEVEEIDLTKHGEYGEVELEKG